MSSFFLDITRERRIYAINNYPEIALAFDFIEGSRACSWKLFQSSDFLITETNNNKYNK